MYTSIANEYILFQNSCWCSFYLYSSVFYSVILFRLLYIFIFLFVNKICMCAIAVRSRMKNEGKMGLSLNEFIAATQ